jgi:hypothetical protein
MGDPKRSLRTGFAALLVIGSVAVLSSQASATNPPKFQGSAPGQVTCTFAGKMSFSPPLTNSGGGTNPSIVTGKESDCSTSNGAVSITKATVSGSFASSPIVCAGPASTSASATLTTKWKGAVNGTIGETSYAGTAKFTDSTASFSGADLTDGDNFQQGLAFPGNGTTSTVNGSFPAVAPNGALSVVNITSGAISSGCSKGSGLKSIKLSGTIIDGSVTANAVSCCVTAPSSPNIVPLEPGYNLPDPAMVSTSSTTAQVYTTESFETGISFYNIPSYSVDLTNDTYGPIHDALPAPPSWYGSPNYLFAPTVRFIDGQYVMLFAASPGSNALCIGEATSSDGLVFQAVNSFELCTPGYSNYDPQLYVDPNDGSVWVFYSLETNSFPGQIEAQQLSADASSLVGSPSTLLSYSQVESINPNEGSAPFLENPSFVADPGNGYGFDLIRALGTFNGNHTYATIDVPCTSESGGCQPSLAQLMMGPTYGDDSGSASLLNDSSPNGNLVIWDQYIDGIRMDFLGPTSSQ